MGDVYDAAIKEYRQAKTLGEGLDIAKKWATRAALGGTAFEVGRYLWNGRR